MPSGNTLHPLENDSKRFETVRKGKKARQFNDMTFFFFLDGNAHSIVK